MTTSNSVGTFAQLAVRVRADLAARRALKQRVQLLRIMRRSTVTGWLTPPPGRSDPR